MNKFVHFLHENRMLNLNSIFLLGIAECDSVAAINRWKHENFIKIFDHLWFTNNCSSIQYLGPIYFPVKPYDIPNTWNRTFHRAVEYSDFNKDGNGCRN